MEHNWKDREQNRMNNGIYEPVNLVGDDPNRFLHISLVDPCKVAYTANDEKGIADIQTRTTLEKYCKKFGLETTGHVPKVKKVRVVIEVRGGVVTAVIADGELDVRLVDYDSPESGDPTLGYMFNDGSFISDLIMSGKEVY